MKAGAEVKDVTKVAKEVRTHAVRATSEFLNIQPATSSVSYWRFLTPYGAIDLDVVGPQSCQE